MARLNGTDLRKLYNLVDQAYSHKELRDLSMALFKVPLEDLGYPTGGKMDSVNCIIFRAEADNKVEELHSRAWSRV